MENQFPDYRFRHTKSPPGLVDFERLYFLGPTSVSESNMPWLPIVIEIIKYRKYLCDAV